MPSVVTQSPPTRIVVAERIAQNILATLETITKANNYSVNANAFRPSPAANVPQADGDMCLITGESVKEQEEPQLNTQWLQTYYVLGCVVQSEASGVTIDQRRNQLLADIQFALTYDLDLTNGRPNATRGGIAEDTMLANPVVPALEPNAKTGLIMAVVQVRYRTLYNNAYTAIYDGIASVTDVGNGTVTAAFVADTVATDLPAGFIQVNPGNGYVSSSTVVQATSSSVTVSFPGISTSIANKPWQTISAARTVIVAPQGGVVAA